eukprot:gnl/MRDRNA2_/MRDRNA2_189148_c0_seq1.p1 gnl/MRDRNA2_/MRDRNA2_189148_c0~~gnl/MRDRNA2_/MRDRNA2_189148_c0_seq1.p1  ORF type:complete len:534 (-),score=105.05 gnl/MRDRNA2_/MRDRNA2_189148_c0_seq1:239-1840(-)
MERVISLFWLPDQINEPVYTSNKYPLIVDPSGQAYAFLKYRARCLSAIVPGDHDAESLRKGLVQCLYHGTWLVLDFDAIDVNLEALFDPKTFPSEVLSPVDLFEQELCSSLVQPHDEFPGRVIYAESYGAAMAGHATMDWAFEPKDGFRLIITTKKEPPLWLRQSMCCLRIEQDPEAGCGDGDADPAAGLRARERQARLNQDLLDAALDGRLEDVSALVEEGADPLKARDGRENTALHEAAVMGHVDVVQWLLQWQSPGGIDPNAQGYDGRTALHRSSFHGNRDIVQLLLEHGADPRIKDRMGETAFDVASSVQARVALLAWDVKNTDALVQKRREAMDMQEEAALETEVDKDALEQKRRGRKFLEYARTGEAELLEIEAAGLDPGEVDSLRDERGNAALHIAAWHGQLQCVIALLDECDATVNVREEKGWTPLSIAAFHGHKAVCAALLERGGDPNLPNAYRKLPIDVAQNEEIAQLIRDAVAPPQPPPEPVVTDEPKPKAKAKSKGRSRAKSFGRAKTKQGGFSSKRGSLP